MSLFDRYDTNKVDTKPLNKIEEEKGVAAPETQNTASKQSSSGSSAADYLKDLLKRRENNSQSSNRSTWY